MTKKRYESEPLHRIKAHLNEAVSIIKDAEHLNSKDPLGAQNRLDPKSVPAVGMLAHIRQALKDTEELDKELQEITEHLG